MKFEGVCVTAVILATVRGEGRLRAAGRYIVSGGSGGLPDEFQIAHFICVFTAKNGRTSLRCNVFSTFSYPSHLKHLFFIAFLEDGLPEMLSKLGVLAERGIKKSKKHHAIAPIAKTPRKVPGRENSDCENTMKMKIANRKSHVFCVFCWFL